MAIKSRSRILSVIYNIWRNIGVKNAMKYVTSKNDLDTITDLTEDPLTKTKTVGLGPVQFAFGSH